MQVDFREITQNPINPRKISRDGIEKLKLSLLVFPKMLNVRPIIINEDKVILCGNMRHKALLEIFAMNGQDMRQFIMRSAKAEYEIDKSIDFWDKWKNNPIISVTKSALTSKEEKELIVKDNISYGEFDNVKLDDFAKDELFDVGLFKEEGDSLLEPTRPGAKSRSIEKLRFGEYDLPMSMDEYIELKELFDNHVEEQGTSFGFITTIMKKHGAN